MIKKLFYIAALLLPGLAYGGSPSANLSVQVVSSGAGIACNSGPNYNGPVPAPAQAAGFTHCALNADFTTNTTDSRGYNYSNLSTWLNNCMPPSQQNNGYASGWPPGRFYLEFAGDPLGGDPALCNPNRVAITSDGGNPQVLELVNRVADVQNCPALAKASNGDCNYDQLYWPVPYHAFGDNIGPTLPIEMYTEITFRIPNIGTGWSANGGGGTIPEDYWQTSWCVCETEIDFFEINTGYNNGAGWGYQGQWNAGSVNYLDFTQYHTIGTLTTSDESTAEWQCLWADGNFVSCGGPWSGTTYTQHNETLNSLIAAGHCFSDVHCMSQDNIIYIKSMRLWECSKYVNAGCPGPVINHWPYP